MITTGKNLGAIIGEFGQLLSEPAPGTGNGKPARSSSSWPTRSTAPKKGRADQLLPRGRPEPIRVNCELNHVDVVLCCDPKAFTHTNPLEGLKPGGSLVWESSESPESPGSASPKYRQFIRRTASASSSCPASRSPGGHRPPDLQLRMQGNSFLGAFFRVSSVPQGQRASARRPSTTRSCTSSIRRSSAASATRSSSPT
jgi:pyruvate-ferredoxin/flavodoxin oxidoreductase